MKIFSGIKITGNSKLKIKYNKIPQIKSGGENSKKFSGGKYILKSIW
jgi:hypothetical protein